MWFQNCGRIFNFYTFDIWLLSIRMRICVCVQLYNFVSVLHFCIDLWKLSSTWIAERVGSSPKATLSFFPSFFHFFHNYHVEMCLRFKKSYIIQKHFSSHQMKWMVFKLLDLNMSHSNPLLEIEYVLWMKRRVKLPWYVPVFQIQTYPYHNTAYVICECHSSSIHYQLVIHQNRSSQYYFHREPLYQT